MHGNARKVERRPEIIRQGSCPGKLANGELIKEPLTEIDQIQQIARYNANNTAGERQLLLFLQSWWSRMYKRPLKDPMLDQYSLEELAYEYFDHIEREEAATKKQKEEDDKIEDAKYQKTLAWADEEEAKESQATEVKQEPKPSPMSDEDWVKKHLADAKLEFGEEFGDDIKEDFSNG